MGSLSGTVMDSSGAAVPNAKVTVTNTQTGVAINTVTSSAGAYAVPQLVPGIYSVRAEAPGFQSQVQTGVVIDVSQTSTVNMSLQVGNTKQEITVQAQTVGIETETSQVATSVTEELVT